MAEEQKPKRKLLTIPNTSLGLGITGTFSAAMMDPELFKHLLSVAWREDFVRGLLALFLAGIMYRGLFRKDIERTVLKIVQPLVDALNKVADSNEKTGQQLVEMNATIVSHGQVLVAHGKRIESIQAQLTDKPAPDTVKA